MKTATVGERFQVVIPKDIRRMLGIKPHSKLLVRIAGDSIVLTPGNAAAMRGIGSQLPKLEKPEDYIRKLRREWESRK